MLEVNRMPVRTSMTMFNLNHLNPIESLILHLKHFQDPDGGSRCVRKDEQRCTLLHRAKHRVQWLGKSWVRLPKPFLLEPTLEQILSNQGWIQRGCALFFLKDFALRMSLWNDSELPSLQSHQKRWSLKTHQKNTWYIANHVITSGKVRNHHGSFPVFCRQMLMVDFPWNKGLSWQCQFTEAYVASHIFCCLHSSLMVVPLVWYPSCLTPRLEPFKREFTR